MVKFGRGILLFSNFLNLAWCLARFLKTYQNHNKLKFSLCLAFWCWLIFRFFLKNFWFVKLNSLKGWLSDSSKTGSIYAFAFFCFLLLYNLLTNCSKLLPKYPGQKSDWVTAAFVLHLAKWQYNGNADKKVVMALWGFIFFTPLFASWVFVSLTFQLVGKSTSS